MKSIVLLGDSIRLGYQSTVQTRLEGQAQVWGPRENCQHSAFLRTNLARWVMTRRPDIVHLNCGLHDIKRFPGQNGLQVPLDDYLAHLRAILMRIKAQTGAQILWATSTPFDETAHNRIKSFGRSPSDWAQYNAAALELARSLGCQINDLSAFAARSGLSTHWQEDGLHFTPAGYAALGEEVARVLGSHLASRPQIS